MKPIESKDLLDAWPEREKRWRAALGRIRLGVEPVEEQVERLRGLTWGITGVAGGIGLMLALLFAAKGAVATGLIVAGVLMGPIIASAWVGFARTKARAARFLREREEVERLRAGTGDG